MEELSSAVTLFFSGMKNFLVSPSKCIFLLCMSPFCWWWFTWEATCGPCYSILLFWIQSFLQGSALFKKLFIYYFIHFWLRWVFVEVPQLSRAVASRAPLVAVLSSHRGGAASLAAAHRLRARGLPRSRSRSQHTGWLLCGGLHLLGRGWSRSPRAGRQAPNCWTTREARTAIST